ncbi:MAG: MFS transporter [Planctomycetota bacterium]
MSVKSLMVPLEAAASLTPVLRVVAKNPQLARLWLAQFVSQTGDWLNRVASLVLIGNLGGTGPVLGVGALFGAELALRLLPSAALGPLAGPVADRLPRRMLMVVADLSRAVIVLGFLLVREPAHLPLLYVLIVLQMAIGIFFDAARTAALPDTVAKDDLHDAYALSAMTWSITLCFGALAGGWLVQWVGVGGAFVIDAATYVVSAVFLIGVRLPPVPKQEQPFRWRDIVLMTDLKRGLTHVRSLGIAPILWTKTYWGAAGGYLVLLSLAGRDRFGEVPEATSSASELAAAAGATAVATGALYTARGVGTGLGPLVANFVFGKSDAALRRQISAGFVVAAVGYALFGFTTSLWAACVFVAVAHVGGCALWVASTVLWQKRVEPAYRGRVFALEFLALDISFALGGLVAGAIYDATESLAQTAWIVSGMVLALGMAWTWSSRGVLAPGPGAEVFPTAKPLVEEDDG